MHLSPVGYRPPSAAQVPKETIGTRSVSSPATPLEGNNNNGNGNPLFTVRSRREESSTSGQRFSSANANQLGSRFNIVRTNESGLMIYKSLQPNSTNYNNNISSRRASLFSNAFIAAQNKTLNGQEDSHYDKLKSVQQSIIDLVHQSSCLAIEQNEPELALAKSREAFDKLAALKSFASQAQFQDDQLQAAPVTTGVRFAELALMVNCNLAARLENVNYLEQSLELYMQLAKLAGPSTNNTNDTLLINGQQFFGQTKFLLHRFGLNIGNLLYSMRDYQRALKYYRLTLDRLASSGQTRLRIKLMNNISLTLLELKLENEAIASMKLLLADNLSSELQVDNQAAVAKTDQPDRGNIMSEVYICHHHRFALNLIVCYYQRHDCASIATTLRALINGNTCRQFERALAMVRQERTVGAAYADDVGQQVKDYVEQETSALLPPRTNKQVRNLASSLQVDRLAGSRLQSETSTTLLSANKDPQIRPQSELLKIKLGSSLFGADGKRMRTDQLAFNQPLGEGNTIASAGGIGPTTLDRQPTGQVEEREVAIVTLTKPSACEKFRQVMSSIRRDRLEMSIVELEKQISRSIMLTCNLLLDLERDASISGHEISLANLDSQFTSSSRATSSSSSSGGLGRVSVFDYCLKLLASSATCKGLVLDFMTNKMSAALGKRHKLDVAMALSRELSAFECCPDKSNRVDHGRLCSDDGQQRAVVSSINKLAYNGNPLTASGQMARPKREQALNLPTTATNKSLIHLLGKRFAKALEEADLDRPMQSDANFAGCFVNLANCHFNLSKFTEAEFLYQQAIKTMPTCWEAYYNLVILYRRLNRNYEHLTPSIKSYLADERKIFTLSALSHHRCMILSQVQSALIFKQSGNEKQAIRIFNDLVTNSRQAPEVHLLISESVGDETSGESGLTQAQIVLQQAHRENPYYLPVLERLIALNIRAFDYDSARQLLMQCIENRPDQVKWYRMLAECHRRSTEYNKAIVVYKIAIANFAQDTSCLKALIKLTDELGMTEERRTYENKLDRALKRRAVV